MKRTLLNLLAPASLMVLMAVHTPLFAQGEDSPLDFKTLYARIGGEVGLSSVWMSGLYRIGCGEFEKGARVNPMIALAYDTPLGPLFRFEALVGYQGYGITSSRPTREQTVVEIDDAMETKAYADVDFEEIGTISFSSLFVLPSIKFYPARWLYLGAGVNAGLLFGGKAQYTKNITSKAIQIPGKGSAEVYFPESESSDPYSKVFPEEQLPNTNGIIMSAATYIGAEFPINRRLKIGPRLLYQIPLTPAISDPSLKLNAFTITIGARFELQ